MKRQIAVYMNIEKVKPAGELIKFIEKYINDEIKLQKFPGPKVQVILRVEEDLFNKIEEKRGIVPRSPWIECLLSGMV